MAAKTRGGNRPARPWWLGGSETCSVCLQVYVLEMEGRCTGCDGPLCPSCMTERREAGVEICVGCEQDDAGEDSRGADRRPGAEGTGQDPL
jgi:hypothetical protein